MQSRDFEAALERWCSALRQAAANFGHRAFPSLAAAFLQVDAARLTSAAIPQLFSRHLRQIDPSLNDDLLDLYGGSEQVLSNHFSFLNRSHEFEAEINWEIRESPAWLGELHAFDYGLDLAMTYRISGEEKYARHLRHLIAHWVAENPPLRGAGWLPSPLARRVRNWVLAADLARADWEHDPEFRSMISQSLALQCTQLVRQAGLTRSASKTQDQIRGLLLAGKFFGGNPGAQLRAVALELIRQEIETRLHSSQAYALASPGSQLGFAATLLEFLLFQGEQSEARLWQHALREILATLEGVLHPDGRLPLFGLPARDNFADVAALAATYLQDPTWKTLAGKFGILPYMLLGEDGKASFEQLPAQAWQAQSRLLPHAGLYRLVGADASALIVNGQGQSSSGAHVDYATFELSIQGQRVIADSGAYAPEDEEQEAKYFPDAIAHNLFLVEQAIPGAFIARSVAYPRALPHDWESGPGYTGLCLPGLRLPSQKLDHWRAWYCLEGRYWVILDSLEGQGRPSAASLLHFYPTFEVEVSPDRAVARSRVLAVTVIPFGSPKARMKVSRGDGGGYASWYAPAFGIKYPASLLSFGWTNLRLPWVGGQVIVPGADPVSVAAALEAEMDTVSLEVSGKHYRLPFRSRTPEHLMDH
jgi:heparinase II/III-like protein